jgi:Peptidase propeptide and YPEB domain
VAVVLLLLGVAFVVAQNCQQAQVRLTKEQAIERAEQEVDFTPTRTAVRLLRQGLGSRPFWIVSLSIPRPGREGYRRLAVVRIDANTGKVAEVTGGSRSGEG